MTCWSVLLFAHRTHPSSSAPESTPRKVILTILPRHVVPHGSDVSLASDLGIRMRCSSGQWDTEGVGWKASGKWFFTMKKMQKEAAVHFLFFLFFIFNFLILISPIQFFFLCFFGWAVLFLSSAHAHSFFISQRIICRQLDSLGLLFCCAGAHGHQLSNI